MTSLTTIVKETYPDPDACVIWMHGLGASGDDFSGIIPALQLPSDLKIRFIFPNAPVQPVTINGGMRMPAWYDIYHMDRMEREDTAGMAKSNAEITAILKSQMAAGIDSKRIVLAGFSQGGAMALHTGLRCDEPLAGIMALSCYLSAADLLASEAHQHNKAIEIFMAHGMHDPVLPMMLAEMSREQLLQAGYSVAFKSYPMAHEVCGEELTDISAFLAARLKLVL